MTDNTMTPKKGEQWTMKPVRVSKTNPFQTQG